MTVQIPRFMITAPKSGSGKTLITCGILQILKKRGVKTTAYKCGPDYIDPMFHRKVLGMPSYNLDTFLCGRDNVKQILAKHSYIETDTQKMNTNHVNAENIEMQEHMSVIEGVMGFYDGLGGISTDASAYDVAHTTDTPVILIVDGKGASVSLIPQIEGFLRYKEDEAKNSHIKGVILNRISPMMYGRMKELIESELDVCVCGYVPDMPKLALENRYLGLEMPHEIKQIQEKLEELGERLEQTLDIERLLKIARTATTLEEKEIPCKTDRKPLRIGLAQDEAFCFIYQENLEVLRESGAQLIPFSPLHDQHLPAHLDGLLLYGGYPELYAKNLSENESMRREIRDALIGGLPCIAECGGFQYLQESITNSEGLSYEMCGVLSGKSYDTGKLCRFGYASLSGGTVFGREVPEIPIHEFHYYDSEDCGDAFTAKKPLSERTWKCMISTDSLFAGYPHMHYAGNRGVVSAYLDACERYQETCSEK